ncbi:unnamed protein product [Rhizophagus irregularis]|nr:unnamed protein product [Rhizophagus irregularis]
MLKIKEYRKYYPYNTNGYERDHEEMYHHFMDKRSTKLKKGIHQMLLEINLIKANNGKYQKKMMRIRIKKQNDEVKNKKQNNGIKDNR